MNWTFTPRLTLETVLQPFVSAVRFRDYKEFAAPRRLDFLVYGRDGASTLADDPAGGVRVDPDGDGAAASFRIAPRSFTDHSLRGSAVLRWEYRPGSALFVVWQQGRDQSDRDAGSFSAGRDYRNLFGARPDNTLLIKVSYWFNP